MNIRISTPHQSFGDYVKEQLNSISDEDTQPQNSTLNHLEKSEKMKRGDGKQAHQINEQTNELDRVSPNKIKIDYKRINSKIGFQNRLKVHSEIIQPREKKLISSLNKSRKLDKVLDLENSKNTSESNRQAGPLPSDRNPLIHQDQSLDDAIERGRKMMQRSLGVDTRGTHFQDELESDKLDKSKKVALGKFKNKGNICISTNEIQ